MSQTRKSRRTSPPRKRTTVKRKSVKKAKRQSFSAQLAEIMPMEEATIRRTSGWLVIGLLAAVLLAAAMMIRLPQMIGWQLGEGIGELGFSVERVEIQGIDQMERLPVYAGCPTSILPISGNG
jgi:cell division protein FtsQ